MATVNGTTPKEFPNTRVDGADQYYPVNVPAIGTPYSKDTFPQNVDIPLLFQPIKIRGVEFKNRIWVSPMCQYSSDNGHATDWHLVHLGGFAIRGVGCIIVEATGVLPEGRISPEDAGLWTDSQIAPLKRIVNFCHVQGTPIGIQLAHAGRKASTYAPWVQARRDADAAAEKSDVAGKGEGGWPEDVVGPSTLPFNDLYPKPKELTLEAIQEIEDAFVKATERCKEIGFDFIEIHGAHGYLISSFLSPLSNKRIDTYGGSLPNRIRLPVQLAKAVRKAWGEEKPLFFRVSATDWAEGPEKDEVTGDWKQWGVEQSAELTKALASEAGIDLIDVSSGGNWAAQKIPIGPGYQVPLASALKSLVPNMLFGSVGLITSGTQAEEILQEGKADVVLLARELLRHADFALDAAMELGVVVKPANQYERAWTRMLTPHPAKA